MGMLLGLTPGPHNTLDFTPFDGFFLSILTLDLYDQGQGGSRMNL